MFLIRCLSLVCIFHLFCISSVAQDVLKVFFKEDPNKNRNVIQQELYVHGTNALNEGNLVMADSIFNLFEENDGFPDLWYNSAVTKLFLKDTCGFCQRMHNSYKDEDTVIKNIFENTCIVKDTTYTDYTWHDSMDWPTKFFIIKFVLKCPDDTIFALMDKHFKSTNKLHVIRHKDFYFATEFVKALYRKYQGKNYYIIAQKECSVKDNSQSISDMLMHHLSKKFSEHELQTFPMIQFTLHIDEQGKLVDYTFAENSHTKLKIELSKIIQDKIEFEPAYFNDQPVASEVWCNLYFKKLWLK